MTLYCIALHDPVLSVQGFMTLYCIGLRDAVFIERHDTVLQSLVSSR